MKIIFGEKMYDIPEPYANDEEDILKVIDIKIIPLAENPIKYSKKFPFAFRKFLFFFFHEGPKLTLNKARAYNIYQRIFAEKKLVFVYGQLKATNDFAIAIGPQACPFAEYLLFPKELTVIVDPKVDIDQLYRKVLEYFKINMGKANHLFDYSKYSGKPLELNLREILSGSDEMTIDIKRNDQNLIRGNINYPLCIKKRPISSKIKNHYDLFIAGAGSYAFSYILPYFKKINYNTIIDLNPIPASVLKEKYGFLYADTSTERALRRLAECDNPILIISTYHSTHFPIIEQALSINAKTKIFVEKPPVTDEDQLIRIISMRSNPNYFIEIGYNRRYSFFLKRAKEILSNCHQPYTITCIVKEKELPLSHWYYWPSQGTRITGNLCHWIDLGVYIIQKKPSSMIAVSTSKRNQADEVSCAIKFEDGSLLTLVASERGNQLRGIQEYIEIRCGDITISIDDFLKMRIQKDARQRIYRRMFRDKGHARMYKELILKINQNKIPSYPNTDLEISTKLYLSLSQLLLSNGNFMTF